MCNFHPTYIIPCLHFTGSSRSQRSDEIMLSSDSDDDAFSDDSEDDGEASLASAGLSDRAPHPPFKAAASSTASAMAFAASGKDDAARMSPVVGHSQSHQMVSSP